VFGRIYTVTFLKIDYEMLTLSLSLALSLTHSVFHSEGSYLLCQKLNYGKVHVMKFWGYLWPTASELSNTRSRSLSASNHLEVDCSPFEFSVPPDNLTITSQEILSTNHQSMPLTDSLSTKYEKWKKKIIWNIKVLDAFVMQK
jgi:hypothetical protein